MELSTWHECGVTHRGKSPGRFTSMTMSDPTFWTPPSSPKFVGESIHGLGDLDADLFQEEGFSDIVETVIGISCDVMNPNGILKFFENPPDPSLDVDPTTCIGLLWSRFEMLKQIRPNEDSSKIKSVRNNITSLLLSVLRLSSPTSRCGIQIGVLVSQLRPLLLSVGIGSTSTDRSIHLFHAQIELWVICMKILEIQSCHGVNIQVLNSCFGLEPSSVPDAYGYFMNVLLDNLIYIHATRSKVDEACHCIDALWILLIRYSEERQNGWFKYLHGKVTKLGSQNKSIPYEPTSLERLRPNPVIQRSAELRSDTTAIAAGQTLWSVYWSLLAYTAPIHRTYMTFILKTEISPDKLQKHSIVIWLVRKLFLGEVNPSERDVQTYLSCLLQLLHVWGANLDVIRSLWIYFGRRLDYGFSSTTEVGSNALQDIKYGTWFASLKNAVHSEMNSFHLFCHILRLTPMSDLSELCTIIKLSLPTLTRQGAMHYLTLFSHLITSTLSQLEQRRFDSIRGFSTLVHTLIDSCQGNSSVEDLHNWDIGRRCTTIQCIHFILLLCKHHCLDGITNGDEQMERVNDIMDGLSRLGTLRSLLCRSIQGSIRSSDPGTSTSRLALMGWRSELVDLCVRFGVNLTDSTEESMSSNGALIQLTSVLLDSSFFYSVGWSDDQNWFTFLKRQFTLSSVPVASLASDTIQDLLWFCVYPVFKDRISRIRDKPQPVTRRAAQDLATIALNFVMLCTTKCPSPNSNLSIKEPMELIELFASNLSIDPAVRFAFCELCFATPYSLRALLPSVTGTKSIDGLDAAWRFLTVWLIHCLLVRPASDDRTNNQLNSCEQLTSIGVYLQETHFPAELAALFGDVDPEYTLISIAAKFDLCHTFHDRMAYKSLAGRHLGQLCDVLCDCCSVSSLAKEQNTGLDHANIPNCSRETLCASGFRAASLLVRHCSTLLYTPVASGACGSSLENVINAFVLPRQLYEWSKLKSESHTDASNAGGPLSTLVVECMRDKLPEFTNGLSQLPWHSDTYVGRIIRDVVRLYYKHLGGACIAMAILNSPSLDFRTHLLQLAVQEAVAEIARSASLPSNEATTHALNKWLVLGNLVHRDSHSVETRQRDAPFVVWPLFSALSQPSIGIRIRPDTKQDIKSLITDYKQTVKEVESHELREQIRNQCKVLQRTRTTNQADLLEFFEINA